MRMWMVDPKLLCNKHLIGEHGEIHKHKHNFEKGHSVYGRIFLIVQIEPSSMEDRHNMLALEMLNRGMNHKSPYTQPSLDNYPKEIIEARVDIENSKKDLCNRCENCKNLINNIK